MPKNLIFEKKNVIVAGGAGFIGSHLCERLLETSKVICIDNFITGDEKNIDHLLSEANFKFIKHDINEPLELEKLPELQPFKVQFQGIQEVYNLACPMSPKNFEDNRIANLLVNSYGVKNLLDIALKYDSKLLQFSSSVVYGPKRSEKTGIMEEDNGQVDFLSQRSSYDEGKRFAETMIANYRTVNKLNAKILRLFRVYGPRMKLNDGQMIPDFIHNALDNRDLTIYGDEAFSSSFCYISDVIDAAVKMMESDLAGPLNIGSDVEVNITNLAEKIIAAIGSKSKIIYAKELLFMSPLCLPNTSKARNELGWMPITSLDKGLEKTIDDLRASKGLLGVREAVR